jgi:ribosomal protein S6--L-glutamate ligase
MGIESVRNEENIYPAIGSRLQGVPEVWTLGVKPNFPDYTPEERDLIRNSDLILYPTLNYAQFFTTLGKKIFPSLETYLYADEKIKQTTLFYMLNIPHPRTRIYYHLHHKDILNHFHYPFIGKLPRSSARGRGVYMIGDEEQLVAYVERTQVAYIQEYIPHDRDLRVVLINHQPVIAYWRIRHPDNFRTNLSQGGQISFDNIPSSGIKAAQEASRKCRFNDVGIDLIPHENQWLVIEANMKYGRKGLKMKGLDLKEVLREKLLAGELSH